MAERAAATLAVLETQLPSLLALEQQPRAAALQVLDNEALWAWFEAMAPGGRSAATETSGETLCAVCRAAARDGGDAVLLALRHDNASGSAWRLVQLGSLEAGLASFPDAGGRSAAAEMVAHAKADGTVCLCDKFVHDTASLRAALRRALLACSFAVPVALAAGAPRRGGASATAQQAGTLSGVLVGGFVAEHVLIALERRFLAHQAEQAADELLREELPKTSAKRRGSNAKRKQREKLKQPQPQPQQQPVEQQHTDEQQQQSAQDLGTARRISAAASAAGARMQRVEQMASVVSDVGTLSSDGPEVPARVLQQLSRDVAEMAAALGAIHEKRRPWENSVIDMIRAEVDRVFASMRPSVSSAAIEVVGSVATQLCVPGSGIDLAVCIRDKHDHSNRASQSAITCTPQKPGSVNKKTADAVTELATRLGRASWVDSVEQDQSPGARVPVVHLVCANSAMRISVLFDMSGPGQKGRVLETTKLMGKLVEELPLLRPLTLVLKQLLVERGLNDPYSGGLSSFGLVLLIAFILHRRRTRNGGDVSEDLGAALEEFLRFFGDEFDPSSQGISIKKWSCFPLAAPGAAAAADDGGISAPARDPLMIEDPTNIFNNVGQSCSGVAALQRVLSEARRSVVSCSVTDDAATSVLGCMFGVSGGTHHMKVVDLVKRTWCPPEKPGQMELRSPRAEARAEARATAESLLAESTAPFLQHRFALTAPKREPELELRDIHATRASILDSSSAALGTSPHGAGNETGELHANVLEMASAMMHIQEKRRPWQLAVVDRVRFVVATVWPVASRAAPNGAWVEIYGSLATGLDTPSSDVDLLVRGVALEHCWGHNATAHQQLASALHMEGWDEVRVINHTTVPVIKVLTGGGLISVDISFDGPAHRGLHTATYVRYLVTTHTALHPLALVLKQLLVERGLNDPYSGGLSSFGLVLLIAFILHRRRTRNGGDVSEDLGAALEEFLRFFGDEFDPSSQGISMQRGCYALQSASAADDDGGGISAPARDPLTIEDPTNSTNNVGRTCFGVMLLQRALSDALCSLRAANHAKGCTEDGIPQAKAASGTITSTLGRLFKTTHHSRVVELIQRTWCPADPHPALEIPVEDEPGDFSGAKLLRHELEAVKAERDAWKLRAAAAENRAAELAVRVAALEHAQSDVGMCP